MSFFKSRIERLFGARFLGHFFDNKLTAQNILHAVVAFVAGVLVKLTRNLRHRHDSCGPISEGRRDKKWIQDFIALRDQCVKLDIWEGFNTKYNLHRGFTAEL